MVIELKILHASLDAVKQEGAEQTIAYMDKCAAQEGYLVIFDKTKGKSWEDKIFQGVQECGGKKVPLWVM